MGDDIDPLAIMAEAKAAIRRDLPQIAAELLDWYDTGLLTDGAFRKAASILLPIPLHDHLGIAEGIARRLAFEAVIALGVKADD